MNHAKNKTAYSSSVISRRSFIKRTAAVSAVFSVPNIVTTPLFGETAPSNCITVGQIGCGSIADYYHSSNFKKMDDVRVVATCDAFKRRGIVMANMYNKHYGSEVCKAHEDFREILDRDDVDAVVIAAHDHWHVPMSIAAAKAGKDVFCQKPLAVDFALVGRLRKAVNKNKRVFQFGTQYRSSGAKSRYRKMVELVRNGYIGKLEKIDVWCRDVSFNADQYSVKPYGSAVEIPVPERLNYDMWMGPSEMVPYTADRCTRWGGYHCPETSLGFLAGCGIHELGLAQWGNKSDDTSPIRYEGKGLVPEEGIFRTLARWDVKCDYANGVKMRLMDCRTAKTEVGPFLKRDWVDGDGIIFHGTEGWISDAMDFCSSNQELWKTEFKSTDEILPVALEHNRNFIDCVKSRQETMCPVEMAIRCDTICHLADVAVRKGRVINWDPKDEEIIGDRDAAKMLDRPYRRKWRVW